MSGSINSLLLESMGLRFSGFIFFLGCVINVGVPAQAMTVPPQPSSRNGEFQTLNSFNVQQVHLSIVAQASPTTPPDKPGQTTSFYDRYMQAGYAATQKRDFPTALLYFKRALDERPEDSYATQAIRNVEGYIGKPTPSKTPPATPQSSTTKPPTNQPAASQPSTKPKPTTTAKTPTSGQSNTTTSKPSSSNKPTSTTPQPPPTGSPKLTPPPKTPSTSATKPRATQPTAAVVFVPSEPPSAAFSEQQAIALINRWLEAKTEIFAPPYDQQQIADLTTGELLASLVRPNGILTWLKSNRAYYRYGVQKVDSIERFVVARDRATIELNMTEDRTLYLDGMVDPQRTDFSSQRVRFTFELVDGIWKIADYKTVNGSLLERSVLEVTRSNL